ncbi:MAG: phosphoribosylglycinamide formyltransferase [Proteobacteria bacterium]|nr:MAG: phosphoribosylglycinamide formyltransferase [Pseudomonadota bacterium]TDJ71674.1 MAG: phosphoribosylglycinamide formyltransferase [Pseudomonadota bacterium]
MTTSKLPVVALISGRGSNLQSIIDEMHAGRLPIELRAVVSNNPDAHGLVRAQAADITTCILDHRQCSSRVHYDQALMAAIDEHNPELVVLAGFMRILGRVFVKHYADRLINIHPSLLPEFPGLETHARVLQNGAREHGASVHFVTPEVDAGPIIIQATVPVYEDDSPEVLAARVSREEHRLYPQAIRWFAEGRLEIRDNRVLLDGAERPEQGLVHAK